MLRKRWITGSLIALLLISFLMWVRIVQENPALTGEINLQHLSDVVEVYTDDNGIPHIYAKNKFDAWRTLGYLTAQERLFQMDVIRRVANGQLSEIFGDKTLKIDKLMRSLMLRKTAERYFSRNINKLNRSMLSQAMSYFDGINQFIKEDNLPIEFSLLGYKPRNFTLAEAMAISGYMALSFAEGLIGDVLFADLSSELSPELLAQLRIGTKDDPSQFLKKKEVSLFRKKTYQEVSDTLMDLENIVPLFYGSNSWALAPHRTQSKKAILANDPHIAFSNPSVFFEAHVEAPGFQIYGHFIPGTPFPVLGHNKWMAWGLTMSEHDDLDLYREKIDWDSKKYFFKNKWLDLKISKQKIRIKGEKEENIEIYETHHGPLVFKAFDGLNTDDLAVKWSYYHPKNNVFRTFYQLMYAKHVYSFSEALKYAAAPGLNITWVDSRGNIANWVMGKIPKRIGFESDIVLDGSSGKNEYDGYYTIHENPHQVNPQSGVIVTANYKSPLKQFEEIDGYYQPGGRFYRIHKLLGKKIKWNAQQMQEIQLDSFSPIATQMIPLMLINLSKKSQKLEIFNKMSSWDGQCQEDSIECSFFHQWSYQILVATVGDKIGKERLKHFGRMADHWHFYKWLIFKGDPDWWDQKLTKEKETRSEILERTFTETIARLKERLGSSIQDWQWGELHQITFENPLGKVWPLNLLFNLGPFPVRASNYQINNFGTKRTSDDFSVRLGPATRRIIDFKDPETSWGILPTGNSGRLSSPFYNNQVSKYLSGNYRKQIMGGEVKKLRRKRIFSSQKK
jgi:penicillin amidase